MAEVLLKIKDSGRYDDGDIICAFNDRRVSDVHVQTICNPSTVGFNSNGLRDFDTLVEVHLQNVYEFKFERVSQTEVKRYNLRTGDVDTISDKPNDHGEYMDVDFFLKRRKGNAKHLIFGSLGSEIWYGGKTFATEENLDKVWLEIEDRTDKKKADHSLFPLTAKEKAHYLGLSVDPFDDEEASALVEPDTEDLEGSQVVIQSRKRMIAYKEMKVMSADTQSHIQDCNYCVDVRGANHINKKSDIVQVKG